jgi:hypothetical protein
MNGDDVIIDPQMQRHLSAWLCAIAMLIDADSEMGFAVPQSDRDYFRLHREPPAMWRIWIARFIGSNWLDHRIRRMAMRVQTTPEPNADRLICNTQVTTLVLRQLCAHICSSTVMEDFAGYEGVALQRIWPLTGESYVWSRAARLDGDGVVTLAEALAKDLTPIA